MKTAVVILNWNTEGFLSKFLPGLLQSCKMVEGAEVIVADNCSTDDSMEMMRLKFPDVRTIEFDKNYGFTGGYNKAFEQIECEYFVLINSDIEVSDGWLGPLVDWMDSHPECGACSPKLLSWYDRNKFEYAGAAGGYIDKFGYPFCRGRIMKRTESDYGQYDSAKDVFWASGACLMVRSSVYKKLGGLDNRFFAHMEEIDLCWRTQLEGWKVTVVPQSYVYHVGGGTLPSSSPFKLYLNYRNNLLMLNNNLAKTFALEEYHKTKDILNSSIKGKRKAEIRIFQRRFLDWLSATAYLLTFKLKNAKSVLKAHKDYKRLSKATTLEDIEFYLENHHEKGGVAGIYSKWIVMQSMLRGSKIFNSVTDKDFYNI